MAVTDNEFTARERELMAYAWTCMDSEPKVDYKKLAGLAGMNNPVSASNAWARIKKKIQAQAGALGAAVGDATPKAAPAGKKRPKPASATPAADGGESGENPTKKARKPRVKKEIVEEGTAEEGAGEDWEETML